MITKSNYDPGYFGFFQGKINNEIININKEEVEEFGWFTIKEIKKLKLMKATKKFYNQLTK